MNLSITKYVAVVALAFALPSLASAATISVSPASQTVKTGDTFTVAVRLDTQGKSIDGVDLRYLNFNPRLLQVVDANTTVAGVQITPESLMEMTAANSVDNTLGTILFSQLVKFGTQYKGSGNLATIKFKAVGSGTATLVFNHTPKSTTDTNVANVGTDLLTDVVNGSYTITGAAGQPPKKVDQPNTPAGQQNVNSGTALPDDTTVTALPEGDSTPFEFSERKGFWQIFVGMIKDFFSSFGGRLKGTK